MPGPALVLTYLIGRRVVKIYPISGFRFDELPIDVQLGGGCLTDELGQKLGVRPPKRCTEAFLVHDDF